MKTPNQINEITQDELHKPLGHCQCRATILRYPLFLSRVPYEINELRCMITGVVLMLK